jgi:ketosteroid isomerase-like protein
VTYGEVIEGVRATIAAYAQALDDGRTDDVVATYADDGVFVMPGMGTFSGRSELAGAYAGWKPRAPQRHMVLNTLLTSWSPSGAEAVSDVVFVARGKDGGWSVQFVARYHDTFRPVDGRWLITHREVKPA